MFSKNSEEKFVTITALLKSAQAAVEDLHNSYLTDSISDDGMPPSGSGIFKSGIDEKRMGKCIATARQVLMGDRKSCMIYGLNCKLTDFCVLVHLTLGRMHFLANTAQRPFCEFLEQEVFKTDAPKLRNYNTHANKPLYKDYDKILKDLPFDPSAEPADKYKNDLCYMACHRIAEIFQTTDYFRSLRDQRDFLQSLVL